MNGFPFSDDNKRYHTLYYHNKHTFGGRVAKAVIDAGFSCPNKDGTAGYGGCIFCSGGSGYFTERNICNDIYISVTKQLEKEAARIRKKYGDIPINAYFQAGTNTYAPADTLRKAYRAALDFGAAAVTVATRADCLSDEVIVPLLELYEQTNLTIELGLQTIHDKTAKIINKGYNFDTFLQNYHKIKALGIRVCLHLINGLPGESTADMLSTAETVGRLRPDGVKIQLLHVIKGTRLHEMYLDGSYTPMEREDYIDTVVRQLEYLPESTVIERLTGDGDKRTLAAPMWSTDKIYILGGIDKRQRELDSFQGKKISPRQNIGMDI